MRAGVRVAYALRKEKVRSPARKRTAKGSPSGVLGDLKIPGGDRLSRNRAKAERVKEECVSKKKIREQLSSQENAFLLSPLSTTAADTNFETPQRASARFQDPPTTPKPTYDSTSLQESDQSDTDFARSTQSQVFLSSSPAPKVRGRGMSRPRLWNVGGRCL